MKLRSVIETVVETLTNRHCKNCKHNTGMFCESPKHDECISSIFPKGYEPKQRSDNNAERTRSKPKL